MPDEHETVLTLADKEVLAEDNEDVLVNVNIVDDEKYKKVCSLLVLYRHTHAHVQNHMHANALIFFNVLNKHFFV